MPRLLPSKKISPPVWPDMTRNQVHKRRLAGAVRSDQAMHIAGFHRQIHAADRDQAAKPARQLLGAQERRSLLRFSGSQVLC